VVWHICDHPSGSCAAGSAASRMADFMLCYGLPYVSIRAGASAPLLLTTDGNASLDDGYNDEMHGEGLGVPLVRATSSTFNTVLTYINFIEVIPLKLLSCPENDRHIDTISAS